MRARCLRHILGGTSRPSRLPLIYSPRGPFTDNLVDAMAAVGVLELEPLRPARHEVCPDGVDRRVYRVPILRADDGMATIRESVLIQTLRNIGYEVTKR